MSEFDRGPSEQIAQSLPTPTLPSGWRVEGLWVSGAARTGFVSKLGLTKSYLCLKAWAYANDRVADRGPAWQPIPGPRRNDYKNAAQICEPERDYLGEDAFRKKYGTNQNGANAYGKCVSGSR